jgi:hypothetical protein
MFAQINQLPTTEFVRELPASNVFLFGFAVLAVFLALFATFIIGWRLSQKGECLSPYSGRPLRRADELSYYSMERVLRYLYSMRDYHNQIFAFRDAAFCRETGRIFPNCINRLGRIVVDWGFIQKRYSGVYVSWGSLTERQQAAVKDMHSSLEGFQIAESSAEPLPKNVEPQYVLMKPGPLYVDINTFVLVGWKLVPGTDLEILIVQRPRSQSTAKFTPIEE